MQKIKKVSVLDYAFSVGKVRALENFLIKSAVLEDAIESDLDEALRLFVESGLYGEELLHVKDSQRLEALLNEETAKLKKLVSELILDKALISLLEADMLDSAQKILLTYPGRFLKDYLAHLIDMHNIKTFLRLYILKRPEGELSAHLKYEGFIRQKVFLEFYSKDLQVFLNKLEYIHTDNRTISYALFLREAIEKIEKENSFIALEKAINDFLIEALRPAKYLIFGPEPVLAYYFAKANEINLIRMIIIGKLNSMPQDIIKERLNIVYA